MEIVSNNVFVLNDEKYRAILEYSTDQIFILDKNLKYLSVSNSLAESLGKKQKDIINKTIKEVYGDTKQSARFSDNIKNVLKNNKATNVDESLVLGDKISYINTQLSPIKNTSGVIVGVLGILRDITASKISEEELKKSRDSLKLQIDDMKRFQNIVVDREIKMIELKQKIKKLEEKCTRK